MLQREDIVLLSGAGIATAAFLLGHPTEAFYIAMAAVGGKAVIPTIAPSTIATPAVVPGTVVTVSGKNYVTQPDGSLKPQ